MEDLYTRQEVAELLKVHVRTVDRMLNREEIPTIQLGNKIIRIPESSLKSMTKSKTLSDGAHKDLLEKVYRR